MTGKRIACAGFCELSWSSPRSPQWHSPRLTSLLEAHLFSLNSLVLCSFGSTILGRTTHEWREKLLCVACVHGRNIRHACSTGDTFGGPRYHLDKSAKAPNQRLSPFVRNHNLPAILCACGSSAPKFFKRFLFFWPLSNRAVDSFNLG